MKVEIKSAVIGAALALCVAAALGAGMAQHAQSGRFAIAANEGHVFVLDTATGQTWEKFEPTSGGETSSDFGDVKLGTGKGQ